MIAFLWKLSLVILACVVVWKNFKPKTYGMRILRAVVLVLLLITVLAITKIVGV
jgi:hypothetical protein